MPLTCNIDRRGRLIRGVAGALTALAGVAWLLLARPLTPWGGILGAGLILAGGFMLFEAARGWCAARAMGLRTPF